MLGIPIKEMLHMAEYIEREVLLEKMKNWHEKISLVTCVNSIPAADVVPVRHGWWLTWEEQFPGEKPCRMNNLGVFCDKCHNHADNRTDFCPNCGAKMDGRID